MDGKGGKFDEWQATIMSDPWLVRGNLERISSVVRDPFIKAELDKAITAHLDHAFLQVVYFNNFYCTRIYKPYSRLVGPSLSHRNFVLL